MLLSEIEDGMNFFRRKGMLEELDQAIGWLKKLDVWIPNSRFADYRKYILEIEGAPGTISVDPPYEGRDAALEAEDLLCVYRGLSHFDSSAFRKKLAMFIRGPLHAWSEQAASGSHQARDCGFELVMASLLASGGYELSFDTKADIQLIHDETVYHVECKRPSNNSSGVEKSVRKAYSQLLSRFENYKGRLRQRGFVAIDFSKFMNPESATLKSESQERGARFLLEQTQDLVGQYERFYYNKLDVRTMAVLGYLAMPIRPTSGKGFLMHRGFAGMYVSKYHSTNIKDLHLDRLAFKLFVDRIGEGLATGAGRFPSLERK